MPDYRRYRIQGGTYFFTVNWLERYSNDLLIRHIDTLRLVVKASVGCISVASCTFLLVLPKTC
jgi:hypothetical protein